MTFRGLTVKSMTHHLSSKVVHVLIWLTLAFFWPPVRPWDFDPELVCFYLLHHAAWCCFYTIRNDTSIVSFSSVSKSVPPETPGIPLHLPRSSCFMSFVSRITGSLQAWCSRYSVEGKRVEDESITSWSACRSKGRSTLFLTFDVAAGRARHGGGVHARCSSCCKGIKLADDWGPVTTSWTKERDLFFSTLRNETQNNLSCMCVVVRLWLWSFVTSSELWGVLLCTPGCFWVLWSVWLLFSWSPKQVAIEI